MTPVLLVAAWLGMAIVAAALAAGRGRALAWLAPAVGVVFTALTPAGGEWPGPAAATLNGGNLVLGRTSLGLLVASGLAATLAIALSPRTDGGESCCVCVVAAAAVVVQSATVPVVWGAALVVATAAIALRWITAAPGLATLAAGRIPLLGAAAVLGAAAFLPPAGEAVNQRTALAGGLVGGGILALVGLVPLGGWAAGAVRSLRGGDLAPWGLLLAPVVVIAAAVLAPELPRGTRLPILDLMLVLGLGSALYGGYQALRAEPEHRYGRLLIADLALAAAGVGTTHFAGFSGALLLILAHLISGPLVLAGNRRGLALQRRAAWLALSGLPPSAVFWGRFLVFEGCAQTHPWALLVALGGGGLMVAAAVRMLAEREVEAQDRPAGPGVQALAWVLAAGALAMGLLPHAFERAFFGAG